MELQQVKDKIIAGVNEIQNMETLLAVLGIVALFAGKKKGLKALKAKKHVVTEAERKKVFQKIADQYGTKIAKRAEQMFRLETAHFKSLGFQYTLGAGMEIPVKQTEFPYGWTSMKELWTKYPKYRPKGYITMRDKANRKVKFFKFPSFEAGANALATYLVKYPAGRWYSLKPASQARYEATLDTIIPRYV